MTTLLLRGKCHGVMALALPCVCLCLSLFLCCGGAVSVAPRHDQFQIPIAARCLSCSTPSPSHRLSAARMSLDMESKISQCPQQNSEASSLRRAFKLLDADFFTDDKILEVVKGAEEFNIPIIRANRKSVASVDGGLQNPSCLVFDPNWGSEQPNAINRRFTHPVTSGIQRPRSDEDIAFMSVLELGELIRTRQITSEELTRLFLERLRRYNGILEAVVSYTEELAYAQAKRADELLAQGVYLGPLHGIPYGLKDIIAVPEYHTTWGSISFKDQVLNINAWVYRRLKSAGAVLVAKLVSGSLAYDDIWFGGRTRNPWNIEEFSTGSSAGPAACTSAGMVPFAIGSETAGSMTYPAARCGVTALRPTFGTVGRSGVMSISESLDKLGPFCRSAADCTIILDAIRGKDPDDPSSRDIPLDNPFTVDITKLTVGYLDDADIKVVQVLSAKGVTMVPFRLNYTVDSVQGILNFTMDVDMLSHFDEWQRMGKDDQYEAEDQWPVELRRARMVPAVDYLQAQRARGKLIREVRENFNVDAFIGNATDWEKVCLGNLVGMPVIVVPTGYTNISASPPSGTGRRKTVTTGIYAPPQKDHIALALAIAYQSVTDHHKQRPPLNDLGPNDWTTNAQSKGHAPRQLHMYNGILEAVVSYTEELAYAQAKRADELLAQGVYLGPLHGIPYGLKDIIAVPEYHTTWGSISFKDQVLNINAWVYRRLKSAGAVLVAKLVSGSLAYDDIWFGGRTRNPWNIEEFSTGSSAGPAACTSAGMVPFAIGSETAGSMTYPAARCGVTALRPTFGTVGRSGVMSISESLDKLGPFCRSAADCTIILDAIRGKDPDDPSSRDIPLDNPFTVDITKLTVGYLDDADIKVVQVLSAKGVTMVPFRLNYTVDSVQGILNFTMDVDMLSHFDEWQRMGKDDQYEAEDQWPVELRRARMVPAVDYLQAQRARGKLIREVRENFNVDAFIGNATDWEKVCLGNLVGMPVIVVPTGYTNISASPPSGTGRRKTVTTGIYAPPQKDHIALALAIAYQSVTDHHKQRPPLNDLGPNDWTTNAQSKGHAPRQLHM